MTNPPATGREPKLDAAGLEAAREAWLESASDYTRLDVSIAAAIRAYLALAGGGLKEALFEELGEPDYKLARWSQSAEPFHYWSRESIEAAIFRTERQKP